jgi:hypothetical protein
VDEIKGLLDLVPSWPALLVAVLLFSFGPHLLLLLVLLLYPEGSDRPKQLLADLFDVPRWKKPFWVFEIALMAVFEAVPARVANRRRRAGSTQQVILTNPSTARGLAVGDTLTPPARGSRWLILSCLLRTRTPEVDWQVVDLAPDGQDGHHRLTLRVIKVR